MMDRSPRRPGTAPAKGPSRAGQPREPDPVSRSPRSGGRAEASRRRWRLVRARRDAIPASVRRFTARARHNRLRVAAPWLIGAAAFVVAGLVSVVLYATPVLGVTHVTVTGATLSSADDVRAAAAIPAGTPLARLDAGAIARRVEALPPVRHARIQRHWPRTVVITVTERTAVAAVSRAGLYILLDGSGITYASVPMRPAQLPMLRVDNPGPNDLSTRAALSVLAALSEPLRKSLVTLVADAPTRVRLELAGGRSVTWGDATDNEAKARVATVLLGRPGKLIDVSSPDLVTIR
jgi:cell division protein FtsQ